MNSKAVTNGVRVLGPSLPVSQATVKQLQDRVGAIARAQNQLSAIRAETLAELHRRQGTKKTEQVLRDKALVPPRQARSEVETAKELEKLPNTREGLRKGDISYDNAKLIAGASQRGDIDETELARIAPTQSPHQFAGKVRQHEQQRSQDDGKTRLEHQRSRRYAKISTDRDDGMTVLYGRFDPVTGELIKSALSQKMDQLWRKEQPGQRPTPPQRMADALEQLITRQPEGKDRLPVTRLLLMADYDILGGVLKDARLTDGTPIPAGALRRLACDAEVLPAIFAGGSQPMDLGRLRRRANQAQRNALYARDRGCVGCGASAAWCQAHHIIHWADGGHTNLDNMCLLCSRCHHKVHDNHWQIIKSPSGKYSLRPPPDQPRRRSLRTDTPPRYNTKQRK